MKKLLAVITLILIVPLAQAGDPSWAEQNLFSGATTWTHLHADMFSYAQVQELVQELREKRRKAAGENLSMWAYIACSGEESDPRICRENRRESEVEVLRARVAELEDQIANSLNLLETANEE